MLGQLEHHLISMDSLMIGANAAEPDASSHDKSLDFMNKLPLVSPVKGTG
jgi:hypothetical protein